jgi:putative flippase GtrA
VLSVARSLRSPSSGLLGQGVRFADVVGLPFQAALAIGFCVATVVHFTLQRVFVWTHHEEFALSLHHQAARYVATAAVQYGLTAASTAWLPSGLSVSTEIVYLATVAVVVSANFLVFRHGIFHAKSDAIESVPASPSDARRPGGSASVE